MKLLLISIESITHNFERRGNPENWKDWIGLTDRFDSGDIVDEIAFTKVHGHFGVG